MNRKWDRTDWIVLAITALPLAFVIAWLTVIVHFIVKWW